MKPKTTAVALAALLALSGCTVPQTLAEDQTGAGAAPAPADAASFEEFPIGDDIEIGPLNVAGVYFQPVDMEPAMGLSAAESDIHIEADISALAENGLGFGAGDWVPNLTVDYSITGPDGFSDSGTFMPMNASDGPHYGANLKMGGAGVYDVKFTIHSPADNGHLIHTDAATGVDGRFWEAPLVAEWPDFEYTPREW